MQKMQSELSKNVNIRDHLWATHARLHLVDHSNNEQT